MINRILMMIFGWSILILIPIEAFRFHREIEKRDLIQDNRHILEDTYRYQSEINWTVHTSPEDDYEDYEDYWEDLSSKAMKREYQICDPSNNEHWLRTKYIHVPKSDHPDLEINIDIEYAFRKCPEQLLTDDQACKNTFKVYKWERDEDIANDNFPAWEDSFGNQKGYQKLKTIAAQEMFDDKSGGVSSETIRFNPLKSGFYIAFQTTGTCMSLHRVQIHYTLCPDHEIGLAFFESTPSILKRNIEKTGQCVKNSNPKDDPQKFPLAHCLLYGSWGPNPNECVCNSGFYEEKLDSSRSRCSACPKDTYRANSMKKCEACPQDRETFEEGQSKCECRSGYKAADKHPSKPCYKPAMKTKIMNEEISSNSVKFSLRPPSDDSERERLVYFITVCEKRPLGADESFVCIWNQRKIKFEKNPGLNPIKVPNMKPLTEYDIKVTAKNIVNLGDNSTIHFFVTTLQKMPDKVVGLMVTQDKINPKLVTLKWKKPSNGDIRNYTVKFNPKNGKSENLVAFDNKINITNIQPGTEYQFMVSAVNEAGVSEYETCRLSTGIEDDTPFKIYMMAAAFGILLVVILIFFAYCCCCKSGPRKKMPPGGSNPNGEMVGLVTDGFPVLSSNSNSPRALNDYEVGPLIPQFDNMEIDPINIQIDNEKLLGQGEFAEVKTAFITNKIGERIPLAAKMLKSGVGMRAQLDFLEEGQILQGFNHPSIIGLKGVVTKHRPMMILTEFMENGSLDDFLRRKRGQITVLEMIRILKDVAGGMSYLAEKGFIHRDLAARNILVDKDQFSKISDFGLSRLIESNEDTAVYLAHGGKIAIKWTAPEAIKHKKFTNASDVWSFGILCWEVMTYGEKPFWEMANDEVIESVSNGLRLPCPYGCPIAMHELMVDCWNHKPEDRPTFKQLESILENYLINPSLLDDMPKSLQATLPHGRNSRNSTLYTTLQ